MHSSNKKRKDLTTIDDWGFDYLYDYWPDEWDYCGYNCPCCQRSLSEYEDFYMTIATIVADLIIQEQKLNLDIKSRLIDERMEAYTCYNGFWQANPPKINERVKEDIAYIWPFIKDTQQGSEIFLQIFGQKEKNVKV